MLDWGECHFPLVTPVTVGTALKSQRNFPVTPVTTKNTLVTKTGGMVTTPKTPVTQVTTKNISNNKAVPEVTTVTTILEGGMGLADSALSPEDESAFDTYHERLAIMLEQADVNPTDAHWQAMNEAALTYMQRTGFAAESIEVNQFIKRMYEVVGINLPNDFGKKAGD